MDRIEIVDRLVDRCKVFIEEIVDDQRLANMAEVSLGILGKFRGVAQEILQDWVTLRAQALATEQPKCPACENGGEPELVHTRTVHPTTLFGPIEVPVRTFRCPSGHRHFRPDDRVLGVPVTGDFTDDVRVLFAPLVAELPHRLAADLFSQLTGVDLSSCGAQSIIESVATEVGAWREKREDEGRSSPDPDPTGKAEDRGLEVSMDGVMVHVDGAWREAKVATIQVRQREEPGGPEPVLGSSPAKRLACTLGKPRDLARKILKTIREAGWEKLPVWEILGDGAPWIWKLAEKHFPGAPQRLDWYHLREHCFAFANEQYRSEVLAAGWVDGVMDRLLKDDVTAALNSIRALDPRTRAARKAKNGLLGYLETNRVRIAYQEAWTSGLAISSAAVEGGGCKHLVQSRFKRAGMRWTTAGFLAVLEIRLARLNQDLDPFWAERLPSRGVAS